MISLTEYYSVIKEKSIKTRDKERTKKAIIQEAVKEFLKHGFLHASTLRIANNANVAHGTVFFYFPTKAELIISSIFSQLDPLAAKLEKESSKTSNVRKLCHIFLDEVEKKEEFYSRMVKELPLLPIKTQRVVLASLSGFSWHFVEAIKKAQHSGKFRRFKTKTALYFWFGLMQYLYSYPKLLGTKELTERDKKELVNFYIKSLRK